MDKSIKIYVGSDHRGIGIKEEIKKYLESSDFSTEDKGPYTLNKSDDYTDYAIRVCSAVQQDYGSRGILICGSGIGMCIIANKFKGIRAAICRSVEEAREDRIEHDSNILVIDENIAKNSDWEEMIDVWLSTKFDHRTRHARRIKKISLLESENIKEYKSVSLVPAILSDSLSDYISQATILNKFSKRIHLDIMDGEFVESKSPDAVEILKSLENTDCFYSVHLMTNNPEQIIDQLISFEPVYLVYVHVETITEELLNKELPFDIGLVINPDTDIDKYQSWYNKVNTVQIMTVIPGKQGGEFVSNALDNIKKLRNMGFTGDIHIDGHVDADTTSQIIGYKPTVLNVGSAVSKANSPEEAFSQLSKLLKQ